MGEIIDATTEFFDARRERRIRELREELEACPRSERMRIYRELQVAISCRSARQVEAMEQWLGLSHA